MIAPYVPQLSDACRGRRRDPTDRATDLRCRCLPQGAPQSSFTSSDKARFLLRPAQASERGRLCGGLGVVAAAAMTQVGRRRLWPIVFPPTQPQPPPACAVPCLWPIGKPACCPSLCVCSASYNRPPILPQLGQAACSEPPACSCRPLLPPVLSLSGATATRQLPLAAPAEDGPAVPEPQALQLRRSMHLCTQHGRAAALPPGLWLWRQRWARRQPGGCW